MRMELADNLDEGKCRTKKYDAPNCRTGSWHAARPVIQRSQRCFCCSTAETAVSSVSADFTFNDSGRLEIAELTRSVERH
ncbi:hypothetical protein BAUCODRAFT_35282 [Baudoinia panamericana UAMH 10762]|uniref:Uncharacterized protein n=1 Tax=Baudoinia panamericana (strain UAMH 10762) TaxID=717646 RepID=M2N8Y5_BAUPA|nr:uncharacterized protein BAUCODRAFT_35282 [Baudoinia panamericana UAMH 10762]EMC95295.1 hypothetical protein BAUCODRAFT_35282 [Baudoinia panamericana UAMH 10762]